ncbi:hypothetical protein PCCS19_04760 [Paenibacillus sp. CCS19]|uniref:polysaccharide deacetylase family protein n=1 Tax=Paenibacillus sp. CCS19 TaxID=3158387 RepID=UPI00256200EA|nr:polysaccharide deacetylase family protein [Paenibacillus cellulosilyticus]GMK37422.1 hypothetical protein PCCS19_04760 [Paenibacillus cellulosilyticus]
MGLWKRNAALDYRKKDRFKRFKTGVQIVIVLALIYVLFEALAGTDPHIEPDRSAWTSDKGFIAVSYFGVSRSGTPKLIAKSQLNEQLKALYDQGYVTISQQDIIDYYRNGTKLPDKALFLSFEDGRNDSALFAEPYLERYNYRATVMTYANKMGNSERKFLQPSDLKKMQKSGYWELGSNGYRLAYINVVDSEGNFIGVKDESELRNKLKIDYYNHYLMDFIRDSDMIPTENRQEMEQRINADYEQMKKIYTSSLGFVPNVYMIMHANTLGEGMNRLVSNVNESNIEELFKIHFNREGDAYNGKKDSIYDLTRVQPQAYWQTNHLLMRIKANTDDNLQFVVGDKKRANDWKLVSGAAEFRDNRIALTSEAGGAGMLLLQGSEKDRDIRVSATLNGNVVGKQSIYLRYDQGRDTYVLVTLDNNELLVEQKAGQSVEQIAKIQLDEIDWKNKDLALNKATSYTTQQMSEVDLTEETQYPVNIKSARKLELSLQGDKLGVKVDGESLLTGETIDGSLASGSIALESMYHEQKDNDDIYDALFDDVEVRQLNADGSAGDKLYSNRLTGIEFVVGTAQRTWNRMIDWAIETF